jgi:hypothetical protein
MRAWTLLLVALLVACAKNEETASASPVASEALVGATPAPGADGKEIFVTKSAVVVPSSASAPKQESDGCFPRVALIDTTNAVGATNVKDADSVIARNRWRFKACYERVVAQDPAARGSVTATFDVGEGGEVVKSSTKSASAAFSVVATCVADSGKEMKFSPPDGGHAKLTFTVSFRPSH